MVMARLQEKQQLQELCHVRNLPLLIPGLFLWKQGVVGNGSVKWTYSTAGMIAIYILLYICTIIYNPWLLALPLLWWNFAVPSWGGLGQPYPSQENSFVTCCRMLPLCLAMHQVRDRLGNHAKSWYTQWLIVSTHWAIGCSWNGIFSIHMGSNYLSFSLLVDSFCAGANMFQPMALMFCSEA